MNSTRSLAPRRLFETDVNNDPPQAIPNPVSDGEYICSGLLLMVFWWVPSSSAVSLFLFNPSSQTVQHFYKEHNQMLKVVLLQVAFYVKARLCRSQGGCHICPRAACLMSIMAQEVTRIVVPFWPQRLFESNSNSGPILAPDVYLNLTRIMALPWAIPESKRKVAKSKHKIPCDNN